VLLPVLTLLFPFPFLSLSLCFPLSCISFPSSRLQQAVEPYIIVAPSHPLQSSVGWPASAFLACFSLVSLAVLTIYCPNFSSLICMATVNLHTMASNLPVDYMSIHQHSRSNSVSSSSPNSRPQSSQGGVLRTSAAMGPLSAEDLFRASYQLGRPPTAITNDHARNSSHSSAYSLPSTDITSPGESPPNHNISNPALKGHIRASHIRARAATSPYPRDAESVHSSSSETEDISMFLSANSPADYQPMFPHVPSQPCQ